MCFSNIFFKLFLPLIKLIAGWVNNYPKLILVYSIVKCEKLFYHLKPEDIIKLGVAFFMKPMLPMGIQADIVSKSLQARSTVSLTLPAKTIFPNLKYAWKSISRTRQTILLFCRICAETGVRKWAVCMDKMTCTYYDKEDNKMLVEIIPVP